LNTDKKYLALLGLLLLSKAIFIFGIIYSAEIGLGPDEAQYWTWSRDLSWGYYSKPPAIAWQIWLGGKLFGNTELGVRFGSIILSSLLSVVLYVFARSCRLKPQTAFWSGAVFALTPLGMLSALFAITDVGMVLFWTLSVLIVAKALANEKTPSYMILGLVIMAGALFKWSIYFFWPIIFVAMLFFPFLRSRNIFWGMAISLLGLLPSFIWNTSHQWATFRHVLRTMTGGQSSDLGTTPLSKGNAFEFLGAQIVLLSPILFILLVIALLDYRKKTKVSPNPALSFCLFIFFVPFVLGLIWSCLTKLQGNWIDYIYPSTIVFLCAYCCESVSWGRIWLKIGTLFSLILCLLALSIPYVQEHSLLGRYPIAYRLNPFHHNIGWNNLSEALIQSGYDSSQHFLFGDKYQMSSILSFYGPHQKRAYFLNLQGVRKNQFSYWPSMAQDQLGKTGYFVLAENSPHLEKEQQATIDRYQKILKEYFSDVVFLGVKPLFLSYGKEVKGAYMFKCLKYNGKEPKESNLY